MLGADPGFDADFPRAQQLFAEGTAQKQTPARSKLLFLVASVVAYIAIAASTGGLGWSLAWIMVALFVHELGHAVAMKLVGYTDVRIFFIPLLGGAATGRRRGVARAKQAIVLLAGPLPGIAAGCVLVLAGIGPHALAVTLLVINGLNLLPVEPLDGGQLLQLLVFSRRGWLEIGFRAVTVAFVLGVSVYMHLWVLAAFTYLLLIQLPHRWRTLQAGARLRPLNLPVDAAATDEDQRRTLHREMVAALSPTMRAKWRGNAAIQAAVMEQLHDAALQAPPSLADSVGAGSVWAIGLVAAVFGIGIARAPVPVVWHSYTNAPIGFSIELPGTPVEKAIKGSPGVEGIANNDLACVVVWHVGIGADRIDVITAKMGAPAGLVGNDRRFAMKQGTVARIVVANNVLYSIIAGGTETEETRCLDSFVTFAPGTR